MQALINSGMAILWTGGGGLTVWGGLEVRVRRTSAAGAEGVFRRGGGKRREMRRRKDEPGKRMDFYLVTNNSK